MHIIVCAKQIRHTYARTGTSPDTHYIDRRDGVYRVNPHDEAALELALRLKDKNAGVTVSLLTMGPMIADNELRRCLAAGADHLYQLDGDGAHNPEQEPFDQPDPSEKSDRLARAVKTLEGDLVLCGKESLDKGNGQVGALLAHRLARPFVSAITALAMEASDGQVRVQRSAGRGVREIIACRLPAVFSVDLGVDLRLPNFKRRQWAEAYPPRQVERDAEGAPPRIVCSKRFQPRPRPKLIAAPDSRQHAYDRIMQLLTGSTVEKKGEMLTGSPESQVEGILAFLKTNGFLESDRSDE
jgi:electron transfer flavoprotein beta subunit